MSKMSELDMAAEALASVVVGNTIAWLRDGEPIPDMIAFATIEAIRCASKHGPDEVPYVVGHAVSLALSQMQTLSDDMHSSHVVH